MSTQDTTAPAAAPSEPPASAPRFGESLHAGQPLTRAELQSLKDDLGTAADPTDPARQVPKTRANRVYLSHQEWKQQQIEKGIIDPATGQYFKRPPSALQKILLSTIKFVFLGLVLSLAAGQFVTGDPIWGYRGKWMNKKYWFPVQQRPMTVSELALYNGRSEERPIYLAIKGDVFDVSAKRYIYGAGGSYSFFAGRDASRAYVTGCFKEHLTHDLRGLDEEQLKTLDQWHSFFAKNDKYDQVGWLIDLPEPDPNSPIPSKTCMEQPR